MTKGSNRIHILTVNEQLTPLLRELSGVNNLTEPEEGDELSSISYLTGKIRTHAGLNWIKKDILESIKKHGYPFLIITDLRIDTGLEHDSDGMKVLRMIILSYILISQSDTYTDVPCNLFILAAPEDYQKLRDEVKDPRLLLHNIKTNEPRVNDIIEQLRSDLNRFNKHFNICISNTGSEEKYISSELNVFINILKAKEKLKSKLNKPEAPARPENASAAAADIVFKLDDLCYVNGEIMNDYDPGIELNSEEIYIIGTFTSFTRVDVIKRLLSLINKGPADDYKFRKHPELILNIPDISVIDITTPVTLAQLLSKELSDFKKVKIKTSMNNSKKMQQSKGYSMISRNLLITER